MLQSWAWQAGETLVDAIRVLGFGFFVRKSKIQRCAFFFEPRIEDVDCIGLRG